MQAYNPYLPEWEYIPDGEPYVFGDRVYVYGSHDKFNGVLFCLKDYVCWSASVNDLGNWTCSGVIYRKNQDPMNRLGLRILFAPDVAKGPDGRYYLYYAFDFLGVMGVRGDLYSGFETTVPAVLSRFRSHQNNGGVVMELEQDMVTIKTGPKLIFPTKFHNAPKDFKGHEFFEASSIRKIDGKYVFVYSSTNNHELCYAVSDRPDGDFRYGGTLVDQGDLYLNGNTDESHAVNYLGNTHGGMVELNGDWYIFYHRQTNRHSYSRQACAEKLIRTPDGGFKQAEVTSCGLNGGPLKGQGEYPARIACCLWSKEGTARYDRKFDKEKHPFFTQDQKDGDPQARQYIANMRDGAVAGFRYFDFHSAQYVRLLIGGKAEGTIEASTEPDFKTLAAQVPVKTDGRTVWVCAQLSLPDGVQPLYFRFMGQGAIDFYSFEFK